MAGRTRVTNVLRKTLRVGLIGCEDLAKWNGNEYSKLAAKEFEDVGFGQRESTEDNAEHCCAEGDGPSSPQSLSLTPWVSPSIDWVFIDAVSGDLPGYNDLRDFDGFILTGSHYSANDRLNWISKLEHWVRELKHFQENNTICPRLVAFCFSHHVVNNAFGGSVTRNPHGSFIWKREKVKLLDNVNWHPFFKDLESDSKNLCYSIYESHGDSVVNIPQSAKCLGTSDTSEYEIVSIGDDMITMQGHPEFQEHEMVGLILPALKKSGLITDYEADKAMANFKTKTDAMEIMKRIEKYFSRV